MTKPSMALAELAEKGADADLLREMIQYVAQRMMEMDVEGLCARRLRRAKPGSGEQPQRLPRPALGHPRRECRSEDPEAAPGELLPGVPGAASDRREGAGGGDPGGLRPGRVDPLGRRAGEGDGHERDLQEPGLAAVRRDRRAGRCVPEPPDRRRLAVPVDRCDLREGARGREDRLGGGDNRRRGEHRRAARGAGHERRRLGSRALLDELPALADASWAARGEAGDRRRPRGPEGRGGQGPEGNRAALPGALHAKCARPRPQGPTPDGRRPDPHRLRPGEAKPRRVGSGVRSPISCASASRRSAR